MEVTTTSRLMEYQEYVLQDMKEPKKWDYYLARLTWEVYAIRLALTGGELLVPRNFLIGSDEEGKAIDPDEFDTKIINGKKVLIYKPPPPPPRGPDGKPILDDETKAAMEHSKKFWGEFLSKKPRTGSRARINLAGNSPEDVKPSLKEERPVPKKVPRRRKL